MMDLYAKYIEEREGLTLLQVNDFGFITCKMVDDLLFINDLFVETEHRHGSTFLQLAKKCEAWGKERGAKRMRGCVWVNTLIANHSLSAVMSYGLKVVASDKNVIVLEKEI
jgi:hypothetical protein